MNSIVPADIENPIELLGIEPWAIKSLPRDKRVAFLKHALKLIASYHHPDLFLEEKDKARHGAYLSRINGAIAQLTRDKFALEEALADFNTRRNPRVDLEIRLQKSRETAKEADADYERLSVDYERLKRQQEILKKQLDGQTSRLQHYQEAEAIALEVSNRLRENINFLESERGPYQMTLAQLVSLRKSMIARREYESTEMQRLNPINSNLNGEIGLKTINKTKITQKDFDNAKENSNSLRAIRRLFVKSTGSDSLPVTIQNGNQFTSFEVSWNIVGLIPYEFMMPMIKNPARAFSFEDDAQSPRVKEFEETAIPYVLPYIGAINHGVVLTNCLKNKADGSQSIEYRLIGLSDLDLSYSQKREDFSSFIERIS